MTADITMTAGRQGGDFDAIIAHTGAPRDFGMSSRRPNHIIFSEGRGAWVRPST